VAGNEGAVDHDRRVDEVQETGRSSASKAVAIVALGEKEEVGDPAEVQQ